MRHTITTIETTPNPRARKLIVDPAPGRIVSCLPGQTEIGDDLARRLMGIEGVETVLIHTGFITVCVSECSTWNNVKGAVVRALAGDSDG
jgi:hypothetical protein